MSEVNVLPFYRSYWEAAKDLPDTDRLKIYDSILAFAFENKEPSVEGISACFWTLSRPNIVKSLNKVKANIENGNKGGRPKETEKEPNKNPTETEKEPNKKADISLNKERGIKTNGIKTYGLKSETISKKRFCPPTLEEIKTYCEERQNNVDAERFFDYYSANGWVQGKDRPIKDWKACVRTWERNTDATNRITDKKENPFAQYGGVLI